MRADPVDSIRRDNTDAWIAHAVAGALSGAMWIGLAGIVFAMATAWLAVTAPAPRALAAAPLLLALVQLWLLLRVAIDRRLFDALAAAASHYGSPDLAALDTALIELGWITASRAGRPLPERARGAMRLVRASAALAAAQLAFTLLTLILR
ncbi:hypothetical protein [Cupriavidus necator]